jgi:Na+/melibiose symporter-like transporter
MGPSAPSDRRAGIAQSESASGASSASNPPLGIGTRILYGIGAVAFGVKDSGINSFLLLFYNQVMGLPAGQVGFALMVSLLVDAAADPLIGHLSDRTRSRLGRRHPFIYAAVIPAALLFYGLWNPPADWSNGALTAYLLAMLIGARLSIAFSEIPSAAMAPELTADYGQRTALIAYRQISFWVGGITALILAYTFFFQADAGTPGQLVAQNYSRMGLWFSLGILATILVSALGTQRHMLAVGSAPSVRPDRPHWKAVILTLRNRSLLAILGSGLLCSVAIGLSTSLNIYLYTFFWKLTAGQLSLLSSMYLLGSALAFTAAQTILRSIEKRRAAITCGLIYCLAMMTPITLRLLGLFPLPGSAQLVTALLVSTLIIATSAISFGIVITSMLSDVVEDSAIASGERSEGLIFSINLFIQKAVSGTGVLAAGLLLSAVEFPAHAQPGAVADGLVSKLALAYVVVYGTFYVAGMAVLGKYRLTRARHAANLALLADRDPTGIRPAEPSMPFQ